MLDTNVALDGTFVADGYARRAVARLRELGFRPVIDEAIEREAKGILAKLRARLNLCFEPATSFDRFLRAQGVTKLPAAPAGLGAGVHRSDAHVASAARHYGAWVLTSDAVLASECIKSSIAVRLPWDVVAAGGLAVTLQGVIRVMPPAADKGLIFARVIPGNWAGRRIAAHFTVCDVENVGTLFYAGDAEEWVFASKAGPMVRVPGPLSTNEIWVLCATYTIPAKLNTGNVTLRAATVSGRSPSPGVAVPTVRFSSTGPGRLSFGHRVDGTAHWNGYLRCVVIGPQSLSGETWRAILTVPEGAPNPFDADALERVLRLADKAVRQGNVRLVTRISEGQLMGR